MRQRDPRRCILGIDRQRLGCQIARRLGVAALDSQKRQPGAGFRMGGIERHRFFKRRARQIQSD